MKKYSIATVFFAVFTFYSLSSAQSPTEYIHFLAMQSQEILHDVSRTPREKKELLQTLIIKGCDKKEIARRVLGIHYKKNSSSDVDEFASLFITLISKIYAERFLAFARDEFEVLILGERRENGWAEVETELITGMEKYKIHYITFLIIFTTM